ncbi:MAG: hypothetical protein WDA20_14155 [Desulfuromonadales bacterium]
MTHHLEKASLRLIGHFRRVLGPLQMPFDILMGGDIRDGADEMFFIRPLADNLLALHAHPYLSFFRVQEPVFPFRNVRIVVGTEIADDSFPIVGMDGALPAVAPGFAVR